MDPYALTMLRNACKSNNQRGAIDRLIQPFFSGDPDGQYRSFFDVLKKDNQDMVHPYDLIYVFTFAKESNDDEELETILAMSAMILSRNCRGDFIVRQRLNWERHVKLLLREGLFKRMYRMSHASFVKLLQMLHPWLLVDHRKSSNASKGKQPIGAEIIMHCTLRYLAGGSIHDIRVTAGMSATSFYWSVFRGINAIHSCRRLYLIRNQDQNRII